MSETPTITSITPDPTEDEAAAIAIALTLAWPSAPSSQEPARSDSRWRFSGRWWAGDRFS